MLHQYCTSCLWLRLQAHQNLQYVAINRIEKKELAGVMDGDSEERNLEDPTLLKFYLEDIIEGIRREMIKEGKPFG